MVDKIKPRPSEDREFEWLLGMLPHPGDMIDGFMSPLRVHITEAQSREFQSMNATHG